MDQPIDPPGTATHTEAALAAINERHGASWQLVRRLAGGHTAAGAHELRDTAGARAVLKVYAWDIRSASLRDTARLMRTHPDTARLLRRIEVATADVRADELPTSDVVHGDFTIENALFREGVASVVDAEFSGKGTRAYDLATLLVDSAVQVHPPGARIIGGLRDECLGLVGASGLLLCASTRIVGLAAWGFDQWPADLPAFAGRCELFLDSLGAL